MSSFYDKPGEFGYAIHGEDYGFDRLSCVLTETLPNGGPPLHTRPHTAPDAQSITTARSLRTHDIEKLLGMRGTHAASA